MKNCIAISFLLMLFTLSGCELVGDIFSAGFYTGIFIVVLVVVLIIYIVVKMMRK